MERVINNKIPWHKQGIENIESFNDITFGYLIFYRDEPTPIFIESDLSENEKQVVYERLIIQKSSLCSAIPA